MTPKRVLGVMIAGALFCLLALIVAARADQSWWQRDAVRACCGLADAVWADVWQFHADGSVVATVTGGGPHNHQWAPIGRQYHVPADKVLREPGNPTGRPMLFLRESELNLYCFAAGPLT